MARKPDARTFGQDLMRGEHRVGGGREAVSKPQGGGNLRHDSRGI